MFWKRKGLRLLLAGVVISGLLVCPGFSKDIARLDIRGVVRDAESGEALSCANIIVSGTFRGTITNTDGYFILVNEPAGVCSLLVKYIGYNDQHVRVENMPNAMPFVIAMQPSVIDVQGVTVTANAEILNASSETVSQISVSPRQLSTLPNIGEVDVFRTMQLLPGISGASDGESGLYVRGGTPDQNLVLFDGMTIYHVDHFFGFFSAFNADAIKDIQMYKGGFPAEYGGRISSVVNLIGKTGNQSKPRFGMGANLLSAHGHLEIPISKYGTFLTAFRRSYTDLIQSPLYNSIYELTTGDESAPGPGQQSGQGRRMGNQMQTDFQPSFVFYDFNSKLTLNPSNNDIMTFSFYAGRDNLDKSQDMSDMGLRFGGESASMQTTDINSWGNLGMSCKWSRQWNNRFHTDFLIAASRYDTDYDRDMDISTSFQFENDSTGLRRGMAASTKENNCVEDLSYRLDATWNFSSSHKFKSGMWLTGFQAQYDMMMNDTLSILNMNEQASLAAFYLQDQWQIGKGNLTLGIRNSWYEALDKWYFAPRASFSYPLAKHLHLKGAWGHYYQFVNRIVNENVLEGSRDFWVLSDEGLPPAFSEHTILGLEYNRNAFLFSVEGYYKNMENLVEFSRRFTGRASYSDYFFVGDGVSKGVEFLLQKKQGALTGWIGYTLGKVEHKFSVFNDGLAFPADNDRRHEVNVVSKYALGVWNFALTCVYATGNAYTAPVGQYTVEMLDGSSLNYIHVSDKNAERLPDYLRVDASVSRFFESTYWKTEIGLSLFNLTNHKNVWYREYNLDTTPVTITDVTMLGFTPTVFVQFNLK